MRFTVKITIVFLLILYITTGISTYHKPWLEVLYWPFYQQNFVFGFILLGMLGFILLSSILDEETLQKWFGFDKLDVTNYDSLMNILKDMTHYDTIRVCYTKKDLEYIFDYHETNTTWVDSLLDDIKEYEDRNQGLINELGKAKLVLAAEKQFETEDGELKKANKALNKYNKRLKNDIVNLQKQVAYFHGTPVENPFGDKDE